MAIDNHITGSGNFVRIYEGILDSKAMIELPPSAIKGFLYMLRTKDIFNDHDIFHFTFEQAKRVGVCSSSDTFISIKKRLIAHGLIDQVCIGGMKSGSTFKLSGRWRLYGEENFINVEYKPGINHNNINKPKQ